MKRYLSIIMAVAVMLTALVACTDDAVKSDALASATLGEQIVLSGSEQAEALVNDSGMSGLLAANHLHGFNKDDMYYSTSAEELLFDAGHAEAFGLLYIWNYNNPEDRDSGVQELEVSYSLDGENWHDFGQNYMQVSKADKAESDKHAGIAAGGSFDFGGRAARYVKLVPKKNYGGKGYGLSEVRLFRHKTRPAEGEMIYGNSFAPKDMESGAEVIFSGAGFSDINTASATIGTDPADMWVGAGPLVLNLDGNYPVRKIAFWNYNDAENLSVGVKDFTLYYTTGSPCSLDEINGPNFDEGDWKELSEYSLKQGMGEDGMAASLVIDLPEDVRMQHLKIVAKSTFGESAEKFGLSGVRVFAGSGWAAEPSRNWTGVFSSEGSFPYQSVLTKPEDVIATGWIGGDGIHAINIDGGQNPGSATEKSHLFFSFQDSFTGDINNYTGFTPNYGYDSHIGMVNHAYMTLNGNEPDPRNVQFVIGKTTKDAEMHPSGNIFPKVYWPGDSAIIDGYIYTEANTFDGLRLTGTDLCRTPLNKKTGFPDFMNYAPEILFETEIKELEEGEEEPVPGADGPLFGTILEKDGYINLYQRYNNKLVLGRYAEKDFAKRKNLEVWDGKAWTSDSGALANPEAALTDYLPGNEFSVSQMVGGVFDGKYINVYTAGSIFGQVQMGIADELGGKFGEPVNVWYPTITYELALRKYKDYDYWGKKMWIPWNYNAKAQPALSKEGELLMTYHYQINDAPTTGSGFQGAGIEFAHPTFVCMYTIE
jgi:F5/8 type C domain.